MNEVDRRIAATGDPQQMADRIRAIFQHAGVPIATGTETEQQRLRRLVAEWQAGRDPDTIRSSVQGIARGDTPQTLPGGGLFMPSGGAQPAPAGPSPTDLLLEDQRVAREAAAEAGRRDAYATFLDTVRRYNIPGAETLAQWAKGELTKGQSINEILLGMYARPEFVERFPAIEARRVAGLPALSPAEVLEYEDRAASILRAAGAPVGFYDHWSDFTDLLVRGVSPVELEDRVNEAVVRVHSAPQEVRDYYEDVYGVGTGLDSLLSLYLDPNKAQPVLERMANVAEIGGAGRRFGANLSLGRADALAALGVDARQAQAGFAQLDKIDSLFDETISETDDLTLEGAGVDATFGLGENGARDLERRRQTRVAAASGSAGALVNEQGVRGVGIADQ